MGLSWSSSLLFACGLVSLDADADRMAVDEGADMDAVDCDALVVARVDALILKKEDDESGTMVRRLSRRTCTKEMRGKGSKKSMLERGRRQGRDCGGCSATKNGEGSGWIRLEESRVASKRKRLWLASPTSTDDESNRDGLWCLTDPNYHEICHVVDLQIPICLSLSFPAPQLSMRPTKRAHMTKILPMLSRYVSLFSYSVPVFVQQDRSTSFSCFFMLAFSCREKAGRTTLCGSGVSNVQYKNTNAELTRSRSISLVLSPR